MNKNVISPDDLRRIINEERQFSKVRNDLGIFLSSEITRLQESGYPDHVINEGIRSFLGSFGLEFFKGYKNKFARSILSMMGLDPNSFVAQTVGNVIEETDISVLWGWLMGSGGGCEEFSAALTDAILETIEEQFLNRLMAGMGFRNVATGSVGGTFREQFQTWLKSTQIRQDLISVVIDITCEFDMSSIAGISIPGFGRGWGRSGGNESSSDTDTDADTDADEIASDMMGRMQTSATIQNNTGITGPGPVTQIGNQIGNLISQI